MRPASSFTVTRNVSRVSFAATRSASAMSWPRAGARYWMCTEIAVYWAGPKFEAMPNA